MVLVFLKKIRQYLYLITCYTTDDYCTTTQYLYVVCLLKCTVQSIHSGKEGGVRPFLIETHLYSGDICILLTFPENDEVDGVPRVLAAPVPLLPRRLHHRGQALHVRGGARGQEPRGQRDVGPGPQERRWRHGVESGPSPGRGPVSEVSSASLFSTSCPLFQNESPGLVTVSALWARMSTYSEAARERR